MAQEVFSNTLGLVYHIFDYVLFILKHNRVELGKVLEYLGLVFEYEIRKVLEYLSMVLEYKIKKYSNAKAYYLST